MSRRSLLALGIPAIALATVGVSDTIPPLDYVQRARVLDAGGQHLASENLNGLATLAEAVVHPLSLSNENVIMSPGYIAKVKLMREQEPVDVAVDATPAVNRFEGGYPNPFNPTTKVRFSLARPGRVSLRVYDASGRVVRTLVEESMDAGQHEVRWDGRSQNGSSLGSGVYFLRLMAGDFVERQKLVLLK